MNDIDRELRDRLHGLDLPPAPESLDARLRAVVLERVPRRRDRRRTLGLLAVAAVLLSVGIVLATGGERREAAVVEPSPFLSPTASVATSPSPSPTPTFPSTVEGLHVYTVSELQSERAAGRVSGGPIALAGYWSETHIMHSCNPGAVDGAGELEGGCNDGEIGITEANEPIAVLTRDSRLIPATSAHLTPMFVDLIDRQSLFRPNVNELSYPPVPIVVIGHLDDKRAEDCRVFARQACKDRFVIERIVSFDPDSVPPPTPSPSPTPFPYDSPPPAPFDANQVCIPQGSTEPPVFSFVGWRDGADLDLASRRDLSGETFYVAITRDAVSRGDWFQLSGDDRESLPMGRLVCLAHEWDQGALEFDAIAGTTYRLYRDGSTAKPKP